MWTQTLLGSSRSEDVQDTYCVSDGEADLCRQRELVRSPFRQGGEVQLCERNLSSRCTSSKQQDKRQMKQRERKVKERLRATDPW